MPVKHVLASFRLKACIAKTIARKSNAAKQRLKLDHS
ncbi:hypothetical protein KR52_11655 [Synechococcus sp. KORDI-52]|nr:hypothetical protein KR52_11655 [Synechococcus sp. KORDI-52]